MKTCNNLYAISMKCNQKSRQQDMQKSIKNRINKKFLCLAAILFSRAHHVHFMINRSEIKAVAAVV